MKEIAEKLIENKISEVLEKGEAAVTAGNNGPYYDTDTNVRNMAHYTAAFAVMYQRTGDNRYLDGVRTLAEAIIESPCYNGSGVYECRKVKGNDEVNGVIGPAWIIEGLVYAARVTQDNRYWQRARECFKAVPFNEELGIWKRKNTKGQTLSADATFNHQLWFAAAGAMLDHYCPDEEIYARLKRFVERLPKSITIRKDGRVAHFTYNDQNNRIVGAIGRKWRDIKQDMAEKRGEPSLKYKEIGYHIFNLLGFALLKENYREPIAFLESADFKRTLAFIYTKEYREQLEKAELCMDSTGITTKLKVEFNIFAYAYNSPAFEYERAAKVFDCYDEQLAEYFWKKQTEYTYDEKSGDFSENTDDAVTLNARVYEYITAAGTLISK